MRPEEGKNGASRRQPAFVSLAPAASEARAPAQGGRETIGPM